jgi:hypothetical protein
MLIKSKKFILFSKKNVLINRFLVLFIYILLINTIYSSYSFLSREDTSPEKVAPKILNLINENFLGTNGENNIYFTNIGDYLLEMKFLYLNFIPGEISTDKYSTGLEFFAYIDNFIEFIFSLKLTKDVKNKGVSIIYNSEANSTRLSFQLKKINANIILNFIEFEKLANNTYKYNFGKMYDIFINTNNESYPGKINKFLQDNEKELEVFLLNSFENYLRNITSHYPKTDGVLLYETVIAYIKSYKTFSYSKSSKYTDIKIVFKEFKEEEIFFEDGGIYFSNVNVKFDVTLSFYYSKSYEKIIPYIKFLGGKFSYKTTDIILDDLSLSDILDYVFNLVINFYNDNY